MFENLIAQEGVVSRLRAEAGAKVLPRAILFHGPEYSGKLSTALELARVGSCREDGAPWSCGCDSCLRHRLLLHPDLLLVGGRYFGEEVKAAVDTLQKGDRSAARYLLIRAVRKLTRRFDPVLWEGEESRARKAAAGIGLLEEALPDFEPARPLPANVEKRLSDITQAVDRVVEAVNLEGISINQVRRVGAWARLTGGRRLVVFENAERMNESARNALLKTLEEPPPDVTFVLTTARPGALIQTVRSRLRPYPFAARDAAAQTAVLERVFRESSGRFGGLKEYFLAFRDANQGELRSAALAFLAKGGLSEEAEDYLADRGRFKLFLAELLEVLRLSIREAKGAPRLALDRIERLTDLVRRSLPAVEVQNQSPRLLAERLRGELRRP